MHDYHYLPSKCTGGQLATKLEEVEVLFSKKEVEHFVHLCVHMWCKVGAADRGRERLQFKQHCNRIFYTWRGAGKLNTEVFDLIYV